MVESGGANATGEPPGQAKASPLRRALRLLPHRRRKRVLCGLVVSLLVAPAVLLSVPDGEKGGARAVVAAIAGPPAYHELPEFLADLKTSRTREHYVQLAAVIEVEQENVARLQAQQAHIIADAQTALRDLQRQDLAGAAGVERLRGVFISIVDQHIAPARVRSVLFTKFLVD
jgi:flagellar basal body-associated protein FliL